MDNSETFQLMLNKAISSEPSALRNFGRTKNVQDQLQEMVGGFPKCLEGLYMEFTESGWDGEYYIPDWACKLVKMNYYFHKTSGKDYRREYKFASMEQLWLAFVMKELYSKVWNGEDWVE